MAKIKNLSVLIVHSSVEVASQLGGVLSNSGFKVFARHTDSSEALDDSLQGVHIDLVLVQQEFDNPTPAELIQQLNRINRDIPVLIITQQLSGADTAAGLRMGAADAVAMDEDQHLLAVVNREIHNREARARRRDAIRRLHASENRYQQLIEFARLPMAVIHESMLVFINDAFSELFKIDKDELAALPVADLLDKQARTAYKAIVQQFSKSPDSFPGSELKTTITSAAGETLDIQIDLNTIEFNDENCLQLRVNPPSGQLAADGATALLGCATPRNKMVEHIERCIGIAHADNKDSGLLCVEIDAFEQFQETLGIAVSEQLYSVFTDFICETFEGRTISLFDRHQIMILLNETDADQALRAARELCSGIDNKVFEFASNSQHVTATAGIALISDLSTSADTVIKQSIRACEQRLESKQSGEAGVGNGAHLYEPEQTDAGADVDINLLLKQAFKHQHLQILFQPMMQFHGDASKNYEVLLGIRPQHQEIYPDDFTDLAAHTCENSEIDRWVILQAVKTLLKKTHCGGDEQLYFQLSQASLSNAKFTAWLGAVIKKSHLNPKQLNFQLREVDVSTRLNAAAAFIKSVSAFGCASVITHFGISVQPMNILNQIPFTYARIDDSFTLDAQKGNREAMAKILRQIAEKNVKTIVPAVDSAAIMPTLWKAKVTYIQGDYVRAPGDKMDYRF